MQKDIRLFVAVFHAADETSRIVAGGKRKDTETSKDFIIDRAIPFLRQNPLSKAEEMGAYRVCTGTEINIKDAMQMVEVDKVIEKEVEKEVIKVNTLDDPKSMLRYLRDTYAKKEERKVFNRIIRSIFYAAQKS